MTTTTNNHWLAEAPVLTRAADVIAVEGHLKEEFYSEEQGGYCAAGSIGKVCGINPADWYGGEEYRPRALQYDDETEFATDYAEWKAGRAASLAALRTLVGHLYPDADPAVMSRNELLDRVAIWNDDEDLTTEQVVAELRAAAREAATA